MMKPKHSSWLSLLALIALGLPCSALEQRRFQNADKTKSFQATLVDYNEAGKTVTVTLENGKTSKFSIDLLSPEDQKYVEAQSDVLAVSRSIEVTFTETKGETTRTKSGLVRSSTTPTHYKIMVYNRSDKVVENLKVNYSYYYCLGSSSATGPRHTPQVKTGTLVYPKLFGKYNETRETAKIDLIRASKKGVAPPVPSGGGAAGGG
ncbi:hypothetical protein NT6N_02000 [Oceaniferula spumae]|uniref:SLA1 homology domain-containing protein n=1 Tax=Oceaniferula spumae TaxID=2979115 RepID=A0AAT9FGQ3_9BACT